MVDSDHASCKLDQNSVSGCLVYVFGNLVAWYSKKATTSTALHSTEAEYVSLSEGAKSGIEFYNLLHELMDIFEPDFSIPIHVNNKSCIHIAEAMILPPRIKHVEVRFHAVRTWVRNRWISLHWISTLCNASDIMTKALPTTKLGAPCLLFLTALLIDITFSEQHLTPAQRAYADIFRLHGPPQCGFCLYDYHTCDTTFPACPLQTDS